MNKQERVELQNAKLQWRRAMRRFFGKYWTKRKASCTDSTGRRQMNLPKK